MGGRRDGEAWCGHAGMAELRTFGTQEEPDRLLGHVKRRHILALLKVVKVNLYFAAVPLLKRDGDRQLGEIAFSARPLHLA